MSLKKLSIALCCVAAMSAVGQAASKIIVKNLPLPLFPGVDITGQLDGGANNGNVSASLNLKTKIAVVSGKALVPNLTFRKTTFTNQDVLGVGPLLITDKYTVAPNGKATYSAKIFAVI